MKKIDLSTLDQATAITVLEHLKIQSAALGLTLTRLTGETITPPKLSERGDDILADLEALQSHVGTLNQKLSALGGASRLLSPAPITPTGAHAQTPPSVNVQTPVKPETIDEQCRAANAKKTAKQESDRQLASTLLARVSAKEISLAQAIEIAKGQK